MTFRPYLVVGLVVFGFLAGTLLTTFARLVRSGATAPPLRRVS